MNNILYIAQCAPFDRASHAGGQTLIYYMKKIAQTADLKVDLLTYCSASEAKKIDVEKYGIGKHLIIRDNGLREKLGIIYSIPSKINPNHRMAGFSSYATKLLVDNLKKIKQTGKTYDVIFLEWTHIVLHVDIIRQMFPKSLLIASEPDVSFLGYRRKAENEKNRFLRRFKSTLADNMKKREIAALQRCDFIYVQNEKDKKLLIKEGIECNKIGIMIPYYHEFCGIRDYALRKEIIFFGQMARIENSDAAIWFINNVLPHISDKDVIFTVIGSSPPDNLKMVAKNNNRVHLTGFVEDVAPLFYNADLFVCPLLLGAGIKVKVLEAFYTGIPVLTNDIGIEGIPAIAGSDYIHCNDAQEYIESINRLIDDELLRTKVGINGKKVIESSFDLSKSVDEYIERLIEMIKKRAFVYERQPS